MATLPADLVDKRRCSGRTVTLIEWCARLTEVIGQGMKVLLSLRCAMSASCRAVETLRVVLRASRLGLAYHAHIAITE
jgi:hypothetical protein